MRLVYLDEAGISNPAHEPFLVVAGVVVNADRQFKLIEQHLDSLVEKYIPKAKRSGFAFHAMELFHGNRNFDRASWPLETRLEILDALVQIPAKFDLPICFGVTDREDLSKRNGPNTPAALVEQIAHGHAYGKCVSQIEVVMRATAQDEVAMLIAEDREQVRNVLKFAQAVLTGRPPRSFENAADDAGLYESPMRFILPLQRIVETIHFAQKSESSLLQIADVCAFVIKRHFAKSSHADRLFAPLESQIVFTQSVISDLPLDGEPS